MEKKTPLYDAHVLGGGKIVPFAGYLLPVQYQSGVITEHMAVRTKAGLFDVSHMGEITFEGKDALANLQRMMTNDFTDMEKGQARYSMMCMETGGIVDDLIVYKKEEDSYLVVVNASNKDKDFQWMYEHHFGEVEIKDITDEIAQLALQGPNSLEIIQKITKEKDIPKKYYHCIFDAEVGGMKCILSRTGYTGEDGFELYLKASDARTMWDLLLSVGKEYGLIPCGLGARDTLRLEAAMPLYGHELDETITPLEADLGFAVKQNKSDYIGKKKIEEVSLIRKRVGLKVVGNGIIREHAKLFSKDEAEIGYTTSGTYCPYLEYPIAMAMVELGYSIQGTRMIAEVRGRKIEAEVVSLPFYKRIRKGGTK
ncbi:MAG: glycine cleavage system aminomethyltransferase GcvT [Herbinix sp.]|nr:glycine cleavage system aminomethyltransferase GcvT [Herbinix sp.]